MEIFGCHPPATTGLSYNELAVKTVLTAAAILDLGVEKKKHTQKGTEIQTLPNFSARSILQHQPEKKGKTHTRHKRKSIGYVNRIFLRVSDRHPVKIGHGTRNTPVARVWKMCAAEEVGAQTARHSRQQ
jgi:hypothetical protein